MSIEEQAEEVQANAKVPRDVWDRMHAEARRRRITLSEAVAAAYACWLEANKG